MRRLISFVRNRVDEAGDRGVASACRTGAHKSGLWLVSQAMKQWYGPTRTIWEDDWDLCCVVDASRWDLWRAEVTPDRYPWIDSPERNAWSVGSASPEWYENTFDPTVLPDDERIGLVTANPFAGKPSDRQPHLLLDATPVHRNVSQCEYVYNDSWAATSTVDSST